MSLKRTFKKAVSALYDENSLKSMLFMSVAGFAIGTSPMTLEEWNDTDRSETARLTDAAVLPELQGDLAEIIARKEHIKHLPSGSAEKISLEGLQYAELKAFTGRLSTDLRISEEDVYNLIDQASDEYITISTEMNLPYRDECVMGLSAKGSPYTRFDLGQQAQTVTSCSVEKFHDETGAYRIALLPTMLGGLLFAFGPLLLGQRFRREEWEEECKKREAEREKKRALEAAERAKREQENQAPEPQSKPKKLNLY